MNRKTKYIPVILLGAASLWVAAQEPLPLIGQEPMSLIEETPLEEYTQEQLDSIRLAKIDGKVQAVNAAFRNIRLAKSDPSTLESALYPEVMRTYEMALDALDALDGDDTRRPQMREILRNLDPELQYGAYYYSKNSNQAEMSRYARAYIDVQLLDEFKDATWRRDANFPNIVYICASDAYNKKEYEKAIDYFRLYFSTGAEAYREKVYMFMGQACINTKNYGMAVASMSEGVNVYPNNEHIVMLGLQAAIDGGYGDNINDFLTKALVLKPNDENLLTIQAKLYDDKGNYPAAIDVYSRLDQMKPNSLRITQRLAMCYYNIGVTNYNKAINEQDEKVARKYNRQAKDYFSGSAELLRQVVASDPMAVKYLTALAVCYNCLDNRAAFDDTNSRLIALGAPPVADINMPPIMTANEGNATNFTYSGTASSSAVGDVPSFRAFAAEYIGPKLTKWTEKGEFERQETYTQRVNEQSINDKVSELKRQATDEYLRRYTSQLRINDLKLLPYDTENEVFAIESAYGTMVINVPMRGQEAEAFKNTWSQVKFRAPKYYISDQGELRLSSLDFETPQGRTYAYRNQAGLNYDPTKFFVDLDGYIHQSPSASGVPSASSNTVAMRPKSDVDQNIPRANKANNGTIAVIIANENYASVPKVKYALADGETFKEYCEQTLGIPSHNIRYYPDATLGNLNMAVFDLKNVVSAMNGDANVIFYYAGHGVPDEGTKDAFLLPIDGNAQLTATGYSLDRLYRELGEMPAQTVSVFLDACFSGSNRGEGTLASARAVAIAPKQAAPKGNMFTLSAASNQETALPYAEKHHGMFTYFLLKKLQDSKGNATLREIADYVTSQVKLESNRVNRKQQTPTASRSGSMVDGWDKTRLRR